MDLDTVTEVLSTSLRFSTPITLAALGGLFTQQVGIWNVGLEGCMLASAFASVWASFQTGDPWLGLAAGIGAGAVASLLLGAVVIGLGADEIIAGLAINLLAIGGTQFLLPILFPGFRGAVVSDEIVALPTVDFPYLDTLPVIGPALNNQGVLIYGALAAVPIVTFIIYRTGVGLSLRAVGEDFEAARAAGIRPRRVQYGAFVVAGAFCGAAGTQVALGSVALFSNNMTSGTGYIAFAAVVFGAAFPPLVFLGCFAFGLAQAVVIQLSSRLTIPPQFISMVPYIVAILALMIISQRRSARRSMDA